MELRAGVIGGGNSGTSSWGDGGCDVFLAPEPILSLVALRDLSFLDSTTAAFSSLAVGGATPNPNPVPSVSPTPPSANDPLWKF